MPARQRNMRQGTKLAFIAEHPELKAAELVKLGRKEGVELSATQIYTARTTLRKRGAAPASAPRAPRGAFAASGNTDKTDQLVRLILQVGIDTARAILARLEARGV